MKKGLHVVVFVFLACSCSSAVNHPLSRNSSERVSGIVHHHCVELLAESAMAIEVKEGEAYCFYVQSYSFKGLTRLSLSVFDGVSAISLQAKVFPIGGEVSDLPNWLEGSPTQRPWTVPVVMTALVHVHWIDQGAITLPNSTGPWALVLEPREGTGRMRLSSSEVEKSEVILPQQLYVEDRNPGYN